MDPTSPTTTATECLKLDLIPIEPGMAAALASAAAFRERYGADSASVHDLLRSVLEQTEERVLPKGGRGYLVVQQASRQVVGTCGYPAAPDANGDVEIAYFTFPAYEGRGYARAMARALVDEASARPAVRRIVAHTLPHTGASTRILTGLGFDHAGTIRDPDAGEVWRWVRLPRA